jgi:hypothetical protein
MNAAQVEMMSRVQTSRRTYGAEWSLFTDWCAAHSVSCAPAEPDTLLRFLAACPARPATLARRVAAIDAVHAELTLPPPGRDPAVVATLRIARGLPPEPVVQPRFGPELVSSALERVPVRGWPDGSLGRRDGAVVAVVCALGLTRPAVRALRLGDVTEGPLAIAAGERRHLLERATDPGECVACAVTRWHRAAVVYARAGMPALRRSLAATCRREAREEDRHDCLRVLVEVPDVNARLPLFSPIDKHGWLRSSALSIRSITTVVASRVAVGQQALDEPEWEGLVDDLVSGTWADGQAPASSDVAAAHARPDHATAVRRKHAALGRMADVERLLDELDAQVEAAIGMSQTVVDDAAGQAAFVASLRRPIQ